MGLVSHTTSANVKDGVHNFVGNKHRYGCVSIWMYVSGGSICEYEYM